MYRIKQLPEDFIVEEISAIKLKKTGAYSYFLMVKQNMTTEEAASFIAKKARLPRKFIGYAGTKDRNAVTTQVISVFKARQSLANISINEKEKRLKLSFIGTGSEQINLGDHIGNRFEIVVRDISPDFAFKEKLLGVPNYFDEQRFSHNNKEIGKLLLKQDFKKAAELIIRNKQGKGSYEQAVKSYLATNENDYIGALRKIPKKILSFYIHAFQSYVFNKTIAVLIKDLSPDCKTVTYSLGSFVFPRKKIKDMLIPVVGFSIKLSDNEIDNIVNAVLKKEGIEPHNFIIRPLPEVTCEGSKRDLMVAIRNLDVTELQKDELNIGKKKIKLSFDLPKGCYATVVIKALFEKGS